MNKKINLLFIFILFLSFFIFSNFFITATPAGTACSLSLSCTPSKTTSPASATALPSTYCIMTGSSEPVGKCITDSIPIAFIALTVSLLMIAVSYMIGEVLQISGFKNWYKAEIWELTKSALLVAIIFSLLVEIGGIANALVGAPPGSTTSLSSTLGSLYTSIQSNYLVPELASAYTAYWGLLGVSVGLSFIKSISVMLYIPIPVLPIPPLTIGALSFGFQENLFLSNTLESSHGSYSFVNQAFDFITVPLLMLFQFMKDMFIPLAMLCLSILLPIGLVFRAMPFLRSIGGMLIAIAIAISIIFPTLLLAINVPIQNFLMNTLSPPTAPTTFTINTSPLICPLLQQIFNTVKTPICSIVTSPFIVDSSVFFTGILVGMFGPMSGISAVYNYVLFLILPLIIEFLLLIIDLVITIVIAENIARLLGGALKLGIGRLKLA